VGPVFLAAGLALLAASIAGGSDGMLSAANLMTGTGVAFSGPAWGGAIPVTLGLLLLAWHNRRGRGRRGLAWLGAKSKALLDALAQRLAKRTIPVLA
jgi:hypothetical protein